MSDEHRDSADDSSAPWWERFFDETYARLGIGSSMGITSDQIADFLVERLQLSTGDRVFDQCCGQGRVSIPLAHRGMSVIGVDLSELYIADARRAAQNLPGDVAARCEFHCANAFEYVCPQPCDAAFNWFTSFGYSDDDEVNLRMLQNAAASLKPGGRLVLDYQNIPRLLGNYCPRSFETSQTDEGPMTVLMEHQLDFAQGAIDAEWTFVHPDGRRETRRVATRLYLPHELLRMLERCGCGDFELLGSIDGEPFSLRSKRCIVVATRTAPADGGDGRC